MPRHQIGYLENQLKANNSVGYYNCNYIFIILVHDLWMYGTCEGSNLLTGNIDFYSIWSSVGDIFAIAVLLVLKISLSISAYEKALKMKIDKSQELSKYGIATMISSLFGAAGNHYVLYS